MKRQAGSVPRRTYAYYCDGKYGTDGNYPKNAQKLVEDAVDKANPTVNFAQYDTDGDFYVDALFVVHAGPGAEYTGSVNDIWSHAWGINARLVDGVYVSDYSMEPEYWASPGDMTIGVYCHELGHVLGLPDFYDTDYSSEGLGDWSLMAGGSWNGYNGNQPAFLDAWSRIYLGWVTPSTLKYDVNTVSIPSAETSAVVYKLWSQGTANKEYFLVENRQKYSYDRGLPSAGLCIYHVDDNQTTNDNEWYTGYTTHGHYWVALEQADGKYGLETAYNRGDAGDPFPGTSLKYSFNSTTSPSSKSYTGRNVQVEVINISASSMVMTADMKVGLSIITAGFTGTPLSGYGPLTVNFTDSSYGTPTSWSWNFGDSGTSTAKSPQHIYNTVSVPTSYTVTLIIRNASSVSTSTRTNYISVTQAGPVASFTGTPLSGYGPLTVNFTDNSSGTPTSWSWNFGDGGTGNTQNPQHVYATVAAPTTYTVRLIISNAFGTNTSTRTSYISVSPALPVASFTGVPLSGYGPLTVNFTDNSSGTPTSWSWNFGDGGTGSTQNPQHVYATVAAPTTYTVRLIVSNASGTSTSTRTNYISVSQAPPTASFTGTPLSGYGPLTVNFTDNSSGTPTSWSWNFGDGGTGSTQNPQHVYASVGNPTTYTVRLIISNAFGTSTSTMTNYVSVTQAAPVASFTGTPLSGYGPLTVNFTDNSSGTPTSWNWNFGDGGTGSTQNPQHVYATVAAPTTYTVRLIISNAFGTSTSTMTNYIAVSQAPPTASFTGTPLSGYGPLTVNFTDNSSGTPTSWNWNFGDGGTGSTQNPQHVYASVAAPTTFTVRLIISNAFGTSTQIRTNYISVSQAGPTASFTGTPLSGYGPLTVNFTDNSSGTPTSWSWNFGDGGTGNTQNPQHVYASVAAPTTYTVRLIISNAFGTSTSTMTNYIAVSQAPPTASFTGTPLSGYGPLTVNFTDNSSGTPTSWSWNFGDGGTGNTQNPQHVYASVAAPTTYTVRLIISNAFGTSTSTMTNYISVSQAPPTASFTGTPLSGYGPLTVNFTDNSSGTPTSWSWNFGDGGTGNTQNPQHVYASVAAPTTFTVRLVISNAFGTSTQIRTNYISVSQAGPTASFTGTPLSGYGPLTVNFTDNSSVTPTSWSWNFGDGGTGSTQNPQHIYNAVSAPTTYTVRLIVSNVFGTSTSTMTNYIAVSQAPPTASFTGTPLSGYGPLTVNFTDNSSGTPTSWNWNFGDGGTGSTQNPQHIYNAVAAPTTYTVRLIISNAFGTSTSTMTNYIAVSQAPPTASFTGIPLSGYGPLTVNFTDNSSGTPTSWSWNFGDGGTGSTQNPQHVYASVGNPTTYTVRLIISNAFGTSTSTMTNYVSVTQAAPVASFTGTPLSGYGPLTVNFTDNSSGTPTSWSWNFGDGGTGNTQNPQHIYNAVAAPTTYTVRLIISNAFGTSTSTMTNYIAVSQAPPTASFTGTPLSGYGPLTVNFTDNSSGIPTSWSWNFGDGGTGSTQNPQHIYNAVSAPTTYTVRLIVSNVFGTSTSTMTNYIAVSQAPPTASFTGTPLSGYGPLTVNFTDNSSGTPTSWNWNFGDGGTGSTQNPQHIYSAVSRPTTYTVTLIATNIFGTNSVTNLNYVSVNTVNYVINFKAIGGDRQVSLSWNNPVYADYYASRIIRRTDRYPTGPSDGTTVYWYNGTSCVDTGLNDGQTYYYAIYAHDSSYNYTSGAFDSVYLTWHNGDGDYDVSSDSTMWAFEKVGGISQMPTYRWVSSTTGHSGILKLSYSGTTEGVKMTAIPRSNVSPNNWYRIRVQYSSDSPNSGHEITTQMLSYPNHQSYTILEVGGNWTGNGQIVPGQWYTYDVYIYSKESSQQMQLIMKNNGASGDFYIDSIECDSTIPPAVQNPTAVMMTNGDFNTAADTTSWGFQKTEDGTNGMGTFSWVSSVDPQNGVLGITFNQQTQAVKMTSAATYGILSGRNVLMTFKFRSSLSNPTTLHVLGYLYGERDLATFKVDLAGKAVLGNFSGNQWNTGYVLLTSVSGNTVFRPQLVFKNNTQVPETVYIDDVELYYAGTSLVARKWVQAEETRDSSQQSLYE